MSEELPQAQTLNTEKEWTIHSLNIHGTFFERWCQGRIATTEPWKVVTTNYPVAVNGHESALDIWAEIRGTNAKMFLLIECKKNNPELVNWVFFPKSRDFALFPGLGAANSANSIVLRATRTRLPVANEGRETRANYLAYRKTDNKTRTANNSITEAARQVSIATESILQEEVERGRLSAVHSMADLHINTTIVPVIVTTASLYLCRFSSQDVEQSSGEIPPSEVDLEPQGYLIYEYPLPRHLQQGHVMIDHDAQESWVRRDIIVVNSGKLHNFLVNHALDMFR